VNAIDGTAGTSSVDESSSMMSTTIVEVHEAPGSAHHLSVGDMDPVPIISDARLSSSASYEPPKSRLPKRSNNVDSVIDLQQKTLTAIDRLVSVQEAMLQVKREKLELQREVVAMKRMALLANGVWQNDNVMCLLTTDSTKESEQ
jgi:hypothetical protein